MSVFARGLEKSQIWLGDIPVDRLYWGPYEIDMALNAIKLATGHIELISPPQIIVSPLIIETGIIELRSSFVPLPVLMETGQIEFDSSDTDITPALPVTVTEQGTYVDGTNTTDYTFSTVNFGTAAASRKILVGVWSQNDTVGPTGVTIGGVAATLVTQVGANLRHFSFWIADVPTGTTGQTVAIDHSTAKIRCAISVWSIINAGSHTLFDSINSNVSTGATMMLDIDDNNWVFVIARNKQTANVYAARAFQYFAAASANHVITYSSTTITGVTYVGPRVFIDTEATTDGGQMFGCSLLLV